MKIAVLGVGGVGGYYGGMLARNGHEVSILGRSQETVEILRRDGLTIRTPEETFTTPVSATTDARQLGGVELAILAVKGYSLDDILTATVTLAEAGAVVLPLLNGVEVSDRLLRGGVPRKQLLGGLSRISAARLSPGVIERRSPFQSIILGELEGGLSDRAERIAGVFLAAGIEGSRATGEIQVEVWRKFAFIAAMAATCGLARSAVGPLRSDPMGRLLLERAVGEVVAVARARGVALTDGEPATVMRAIDSMPPAMKPSFLLDLESGGATELDDLSGAVSRLGRLAQVETPIHDTATAALMPHRVDASPGRG
jgi:2-dehydropantoate 2-reductase